MSIFQTINDIIFKMTWLDQGVRWMLSEVFGMDTGKSVFEGLSFFIYDVIKIFILLAVLIFIASYFQSYFSPERTKKMLLGKKGLMSNTIGALLGTVTPFCSCSSIPIFIGFTKAGLPIGVTFSFLISSPLVDLASVILLASIFNWSIAILYVLVGLLIAIVGGSLISAFKLERYVESFVRKPVSDFIGSEQVSDDFSMTRSARIAYAKEQVKEIIMRVWPYILIGVAIGAFIHGFIPEAWIQSVLGQNNLFSVPIATILGIPMYADIFGTLPIAEALVGKGVGIGTVLAFMMSVTALSLPSMIMLKKVVKMPLLVTYVGIVTTGILIMGFVFNIFNSLLI